MPKSVSMDDMPVEVAMAIIKATADPTTVVAWRAVSRFYRGIATDAIVWQYLYERRFGPRLHNYFETHAKDWQWLYQACAADGTRPGATVGRLSTAFFTDRRACVYWGDLVEGVPHGYGLAIESPTPLCGAHTLEPIGRVGGPGQGYSIYEGWWVGGQRHGHGVSTDPSGDRYEGQYKDDVPHGQGTYRHHSGTRYEGSIRAGLMDGYGVFTWPNGERHDGNFRDDKIHGYGVHTWRHGEKHEGWYENETMCGPGVQVCPTGTKYRGHFKHGRRHGHGTLTWDDITYTGAFDSDMMHGFGVYVTSVGSSFKGQYERDKRHGWGVFTFGADRSRLWGSWVHDECAVGEVVDHGTRRTPCTAKSRCHACASAPAIKPDAAGMPVSFLDLL